jgi:hypothetical protein
MKLKNEKYYKRLNRGGDESILRSIKMGHGIRLLKDIIIQM